MIKWKPVRRLALTAGASLCLLLALAYWWQTNLVHELAGVAMFALVGRHVYVNRVSLLNMFRRRGGVKRRLVSGLHLMFIANMLVLQATSLAISQSVFAWLPIRETVTVRDLHWVSAYWLVMTVGVHVGLHWSRVMAMTRSILRIRGESGLRAWILRMVATAFAAFGLWSCGVLNLITKLTWNYSLEFWDFADSVAPFFLHWGGVLALPAVVTYYLVQIGGRTSTKI
ncbi:DUF4405 domain-containing protein [Kaistia nematophila]|uniref:DUF4405 domain-containing protein n=1 Tax=Kaistia nematophila TaxID=2994654 RepID=A0A9X3DZG5_9HYPH|nr:DUF4405 domain-containing protein [Kaistia nematophila]MCX5568178.1 DUF4405 domain-containing protein [Kaistia nematophila]